MTPLAIAFMVLSWGFVLGLASWSFSRVFRAQRQRKEEDPRGP